MNDYIRRKDALDAICENCEIGGDEEPCPHKFTGCPYGRVFGIPAADVRPVVRGMWLAAEYCHGTEDHEEGWFERRAEDGDAAYCSKCRASAGSDAVGDYVFYVLSNFCPNCGADMREEESNERNG